MNIGEYDRIKADPHLTDRVAFSVFYAMGRARDPHFTTMWALVPQQEKDRCAKVGLAAILALVDDYTTPGCECDYCRGESNPGRLIMCRQRWEALPAAARAEIAESCAD